MAGVAGNPKDSPWRSTPRAKRHRKGVELMLSDAARERLDALAEARGRAKSQVVEELIMEAKMDTTMCTLTDLRNWLTDHAIADGATPAQVDEVLQAIRIDDQRPAWGEDWSDYLNSLDTVASFEAGEVIRAR